MTLVKVRRVGGSLVVIIPNEVAGEQGLRPGELVNIDVRRAKKSFFGSDHGVGPFTRDDEMADRDFEKHGASRSSANRLGRAQDRSPRG